jgi:hypothetical protein
MRLPSDDLCDACEIKFEKKNLHRIAELSLVDDSDNEDLDLLKGVCIITTYLANGGSTITITKK